MIIAVTDRHSCIEDFYKRIKRIYRSGVDKIILREKDLSDEEYINMAVKCREICGDKLYINSRAAIAKEIGVKNIHMPIRLFKGKEGFDCAGVSVHSKDEALKAQILGADYVIAGHIFSTDCKKGLPPRGVDYIKDISSAVDIPVYAIGGITKETVTLLKDSGISGICVMSGLMKTPEPEKLIEYLKNACGEFL